MIYALLILFFVGLIFCWSMSRSQLFDLCRSIIRQLTTITDRYINESLYITIKNTTAINIVNQLYITIKNTTAINIVNQLYITRSNVIVPLRKASVTYSILYIPY